MNQFTNASPKDMGICECCGAPAVSVSTACAIPGVMDEETHRWCERCLVDLAELNVEPENNLAEDIDVENEAALGSAYEQMLDIQRRRTTFMRQREGVGPGRQVFPRLPRPLHADGGAQIGTAPNHRQALSWVLSKGYVTAAIPGMTTRDQVDLNLNTMRSTA